MKDCIDYSWASCSCLGWSLQQVRRHPQRSGDAARSHHGAWSAGGCGPAAPRRPDSQPGGDGEGLRHPGEPKSSSNIADARAALLRRRTPPEKIAANEQLDGALGRLLVIGENYPQLKSNENFLRLQDELAGTENRIAVERRKYNETHPALQYDHRAFPNNIVAGMFGFTRNDAYFKTEPGARDQSQRCISKWHPFSQTTSTASGSTGGATFENRNPANTGEVVGHFVKGTPADVDAAAAAAQAAFPGWSTMTADRRAATSCTRPPTSSTGTSSQIAADMTREEGKTLPEAKGEVRRAINIFRYFAGEGSRLPGMLVPSERDRVHMFALRKPIGVVGLVTPWNFPTAIPAWKLAPALICGNTVVLKPASAAPLSAWRIVEALPRGRHSQGRGQLRRRLRRRTWAGALVNATPASRRSPSPAPARSAHWLHAEASRSAACASSSRWAARIRPSCWPTADFNSAVENVVNAAFFSTGQKCTATSRAIVEDAIYDKFVAARGGAHEEAEGRRRHAARHRYRPVRGQGADGDRPALHRDRHARNAASRCAAATA